MSSHSAEDDLEQLEEEEGQRGITRRRRRGLLDKYFCISQGCKAQNGGQPRPEFSGGRNHSCSVCASRLRVQCRHCPSIFCIGAGQTNHINASCPALKTVLLFLIGKCFGYFLILIYLFMYLSLSGCVYRKLIV